MQEQSAGDVAFRRDEKEEIDSHYAPSHLDRRGFVKTSLGAGFAAAVLPVSAQTMIKTDSQGLDAGETKIATADGAMPGYYAKPAGKSGLATVLVVQEVFGVHEHIKDVCRRFAKEGFLAVAPELYARQGDPAQYPDISKLISELVSKVSDAQVISDFDATVAWYGPVARSYYPGDKTVLDVAAQIKAPVLGLYGAADGGIPVDTVEKAFAILKESGNTKSEYVMYPDTPHAFNADYRPSYRKEAAEDGWKRCLAWFRKNGVA